MAKILFATDANGVKFYPITITDAVAHINKEGVQKKLSEVLEGIQSDIANIDYSGKADKVTGEFTENNFAGLDANGNLKDSGKKASDFATAAQGDKADSAVQTVETGDTNGTIKVDDTEVSVKGLGTAAFTGSDAYDAAGTAAGVKSDLEGDAENDTKDSKTIEGAKKYAADLVNGVLTDLAGALQYKGAVNANADLPTNLTADNKGAVYVVATAGTYDGEAMEVGDYLIWNGTGWDKLNGENQVSNENAELEIGTAKKVATVDGTDITVTQVEDMTKIEAVAVADTTDYADVTALFTAA